MFHNLRVQFIRLVFFAAVFASSSLQAVRCLDDTLQLVHQVGLTGALRDFGKASKRVSDQDPLTDSMLTDALNGAVTAFQKALKDSSLTSQSLIELAEKLEARSPDASTDGGNQKLGHPVDEAHNFHLHHGNHPSVSKTPYINSLHVDGIRSMKVSEVGWPPRLSWGPDETFSYDTFGGNGITSLGIGDSDTGIEIALVKDLGHASLPPHFIGNGLLARLNKDGVLHLIPVENAKGAPIPISLGPDFTDPSIKPSWGPNGMLAVATSGSNGAKITIVKVDPKEKKIVGEESISLGTAKLLRPVWNDQGQLLVLNEANELRILDVGSFGIIGEAGARLKVEEESATSHKIPAVAGPRGLVGLVDFRGDLRVYQQDLKKGSLTKIFSAETGRGVKSASWDANGLLAVVSSSKIFVFDTDPKTGVPFQKDTIVLKEYLEEKQHLGNTHFDGIHWGPHRIMVTNHTALIDNGPNQTKSYKIKAMIFQFPEGKEEIAWNLELKDPRVRNDTTFVFGPEGVVASTSLGSSEVHIYNISEKKPEEKERK